MKMVRRCPKCNEIMYEYKKGDNPSQLWRGASIAIHMIVCDPDGFNEHLRKHW